MTKPWRDRQSAKWRSAQEAPRTGSDRRRISPQQLTGFLGNDWAEPGQITALTSIYGDQQKGDDWIEINDMPFNKRTGQFGTKPEGVQARIKASEKQGFMKQYEGLTGVKAYKEMITRFNNVRDHEAGPRDQGGEPGAYLQHREYPRSWLGGP